MVIVETSVFTRQILSLLTDNEYRQLQVVVANRPTVGEVIKNSGGLRKVRWAMAGRGKRGGIRVIYYWAVKSERLLMLFAYPKNERDDLTAEQLKILRRLVESEYP